MFVDVQTVVKSTKKSHLRWDFKFGVLRKLKRCKKS